MKKEIHGRTFELVTISQLAKMCGRKASTIRKWEFIGRIPAANLRSADVPLAGGNVRKGFRLYTMALAIEFSQIVKNDVVQGIKIPQETLERIKKLFDDERNKIGEQ